MNVFLALITAQRKVMAETKVYCVAARMNVLDVSELQKSPQFQPAVPNPTSWVGYAGGIEIKVDNSTRQGWVNLHGPGLDTWALVRLDAEDAPPPTCWDKLLNDDLV